MNCKFILHSTKYFALWPYFGLAGKVLFQKLDRVDILELRRTILANVPSDYVGFNKYWDSLKML